MPYHYLFKYIIVGDTSVGKSCMLLKFTNNTFQASHDVTVGIEFGSRTLTVPDHTRIKLQIWDTAGQEAFRSITRSYYRDAAAALLVYDVTKRETFEHVVEWLEEARLHGGASTTYVLVGNKCDRGEGRVVSREEGEEFGRRNGVMFMETSAKSGKNIERVFRESAKEIVEKVKNGDLSVAKGSSSPGITLGYIYGVAEGLLSSIGGACSRMCSFV